MTKASEAEERRLIAVHRGAAEVLQTPKRNLQSEVSANVIFENRVAISVSEAAYAWGISTRTVERMIQRNEIRFRRLGKRILIPKEELGAWLNRKE